MQTFLPYENFAASAKVLDMKRLGKQRVEALQILEALGGRRSNWTHHPAVRMWSGSEFTLATYGQCMCLEWRERGYKDNLHEQFIEILISGMIAGVFVPGRNDSPPWWLGHAQFHRSHRSQLLRKMPEHYRQFWPDEPDDLNYVWPPERPLD